MLMIHNCRHRAEQCMLALFNGIDKPFSGINFLLDKKNGFLLPFIFFSTPIIFFQHFPVSFTNAKLRCIFRIQSKFQFAVIIDDKKIRYYITFGLIYLTHISTWFWTQADYLLHDFF